VEETMAAVEAVAVTSAEVEVTVAFAETGLLSACLFDVFQPH